MPQTRGKTRIRISWGEREPFYTVHSLTGSATYSDGRTTVTKKELQWIRKREKEFEEVQEFLSQKYLESLEKRPYKVPYAENCEDMEM